MRMLCLCLALMKLLLDVARLLLSFVTTDGYWKMTAPVKTIVKEPMHSIDMINATAFDLDTLCVAVMTRVS